MKKLNNETLLKYKQLRDEKVLADFVCYASLIITMLWIFDGAIFEFLNSPIDYAELFWNNVVGFILVCIFVEILSYYHKVKNKLQYFEQRNHLVEKYEKERKWVWE